MELFRFECFAGSGGGILGGILDGQKTVGAIETEAYRRAVLIQRQKDKILPWFPIWDDVSTFSDDNPDCREYVQFLRGIRDRLIISGGFPCQDISTAGKGKGIDGERSGLFFEFARIVGEIRPRYWFMENSPALTLRGFDRVLGTISEMGYNARWCVVGADNAGAPHQRKRIWILAHTAETQWGAGAEKSGILRRVQKNREESNNVDGPGETLAYSNEKGLEEWEGIPGDNGEKQQATIRGGCHWWDIDPADIPNTAGERFQDRATETMGEPESKQKSKRQISNAENGPAQSQLGRVAHGMASKMDRTINKCYNNNYERKQLFKKSTTNNGECKALPGVRGKQEKAPGSPQRQRQEKQFSREPGKSLPELPQEYSCECGGLGAWKDKIKSGELQDLREIIYSETLQRKQKEFLVWFGSMHGREWTAEFFKAMGQTKRVGVKIHDRVERLKAIGDGQVPAVASIAWRILSEGL